MRLTKESEYALRGLKVLAMAEEGVVMPVAEIAEIEGLPPQFLGRVFNKLSRQGLVVATRGPGEGCRLARPAEQIILGEILEATEGPDVRSRCLFWQGHGHEDKPCALHHLMKVTIESTRALMDDLTLADFVAGLPEASRLVQGPSGRDQA